MGETGLIKISHGCSGGPPFLCSFSSLEHPTHHRPECIVLRPAVQFRSKSNHSSL